MLKPLAEAIPKITVGKTEEESVEPQISEIIEAALRLASEHPVEALGTDTRQLIDQTVDESIWNSGPVRMMKWVLPTLAILALGGVIYGDVKVEGLRNYSEQVEGDIKKAQSEVKDAADRSEDKIIFLKNSALEDWRKQLNAAAGSSVGQFTADIDVKKRDTIDKISKIADGETADIAKTYSNQIRSSIDTAEDKAAKAIEKSGSDIVKLLEGKQGDLNKTIDGIQETVQNDRDSFVKKYNSSVTTLDEELNQAVNPITLADLKKKLDDLHASVDTLESTAKQLGVLADETREIRAMVRKNDEAQIVGYGTLVRLLALKDFILLTTVIVAAIAIILSLTSYIISRKTRRSRTIGVNTSPTT